MIVLYNGTDITTYAQITQCTVHDLSDGRADSAEIELSNAAAWNRWMPRSDDRIEIRLDNYTTGTLFVNTLLPDGDKYEIIATSMPAAAWHHGCETFINKTFSDVLHACAASIGMTEKLYGTDGQLAYGFLMRDNEGRAHFLDRICRMEGLMLKAYNGIIRAVSIPWAQAIESQALMTINSGEPGISYTNQSHMRWSSLTVRTPFGEATAFDADAEGCGTQIITDLPATDSAQAGRWARGLLLWHNRECEELNIDGLPFSPDVTAMARIDADGNTQASGQWLVSECQHDLINLSTSISLRRAITSIS